MTAPGSVDLGPEAGIMSPEGELLVRGRVVRSVGWLATHEALSEELGGLAVEEDEALSPEEVLWKGLVVAGLLDEDSPDQATVDRIVLDASRKVQLLHDMRPGQPVMLFTRTDTGKVTIMSAGILRDSPEVSVEAPGLNRSPEVKVRTKFTDGRVTKEDWIDVSGVVGSEDVSPVVEEWVKGLTYETDLLPNLAIYATLGANGEKFQALVEDRVRAFKTYFLEDIERFGQCPEHSVSELPFIRQLDRGVHQELLSYVLDDLYPLGIRESAYEELRRVASWPVNKHGKFSLKDRLARDADAVENLMLALKLSNQRKNR